MDTSQGGGDISEFTQDTLCALGCHLRTALWCLCCEHRPFLLPGPPPFYNIRLKAEGSDEWRGQPGLLSAALGWSNLYSCPAKAVPGRASVAGWRMERVCKRHFSSPIHHLFTVPRVRALASKRKHSLLGLV